MFQVLYVYVIVLGMQLFIFNWDTMYILWNVYILRASFYEYAKDISL